MSSISLPTEKKTDHGSLPEGNNPWSDGGNHLNYFQVKLMSSSSGVSASSFVDMVTVYCRYCP